MKKIIDISQHNGQINFEKVKNDGIDGVIIRVGWIGNKQNHTLDTKFEENYKKAKENGFKVGFYVYSYCKSVETLRQGVNWLLEKIDTKQNEIGVFLDLEDKTIQEIGRQNLTDQAKQFCEIIKNSGYIAGIYANKYWFEHLLDIKQLLNYKIWLAEWNKKDNYSVTFRVDIWQYGQTEIKGINGQVDINDIYYGTNTIFVDIEQIAKDVIGIREGHKHFGAMHIMNTKKGTYFLADTLINRHPDSETLVDIARLARHAVKFFAHEPVMAMVSYSNFGADNTGSPVQVHEAVREMQENYPELAIDGEMQINFALNTTLRDKTFPFNKLAGKEVNTLIFPNLSSANSAYKMLLEMGLAESIGPIQMGLNKPIHFTDIESSSRDIVNLTTVAVLDAIVQEEISKSKQK